MLTAGPTVLLSKPNSVTSRMPSPPGKTIKMNPMQKLAEKGVDAVDWWNSIGRSGEFHVITPEKSLRKVEFIPTKESGKRYVVERCQELLGEH